MITFRVDLDDLRPGRPQNRTLKDAILLEIFQNDLLVSSLATLPERIELWVGEAADPFGSVVDDDVRVSNTKRCEDFDGLRVTAVGGSDRPRITVARTAGGTSPLYVSSNRSRICVSWKFEEVVALLERPQPNVEICRLVLKYGNGQTREQVIRGVFAVWPGEVVVFDDGGLKFSLCENIGVALPSSLKDRARATDAFLEEIGAVLEPTFTKAKRPMLEFSGGMDSTCVALAASGLRDALESYGVIQPGAVGRQQQARREELIELLGLVDYTASACSILPIEALLINECRVTPNDDAYRMCLMNTLETHGLNDVDLVVSGIGGDELAKDHTFLREEWELPGHASVSSIVGSMGRGDMFMRRGIWSVNPFANPRVVNFCRALPAAMRENRLFNRLAITRAGLSDGYMLPRYHENFANVLMLEAIDCDFDDFLGTSILGDFGILDVSRLLSKAHSGTELGVPIKLVSKMYHTIKLEIILRTYVA